LFKKKLYSLRQFSKSFSDVVDHWALTPAAVEICTDGKTISYEAPSALSCERYHPVPCLTTVPEPNILVKMDRLWRLHSMATQPPNLTPMDFSFWEFVKDNVYIPPMPVDLQELCDRIVNAVALVHVTFLGKLWVELEYRLDVCRITRRSNIEHLYIKK
jgi:hypothetical protein